MRHLVAIVAMVLFFSAGSPWAGAFEAAGKADGNTVRVTFDKSQPSLGVNQVEIAITDQQSRPISNVQVNVEYFMPSLPGKPPMMDYLATAKPVGKNKYVAILNLDMKGEWRMVVSMVTVAEAKQTEAVTFAFEVK